MKQNHCQFFMRIIFLSFNSFLFFFICSIICKRIFSIKNRQTRAIVRCLNLHCHNLLFCAKVFCRITFFATWCVILYISNISRLAGLQVSGNLKPVFLSMITYQIASTENYKFWKVICVNCVCKYPKNKNVRIYCSSR